MGDRGKSFESRTRARVVAPNDERSGKEHYLGTITLTWSQVLIIVVVALGIYVIELLAFMRAARRQVAQEQRSAASLESLSADLGLLRERLDEMHSVVEGMRRMPQSSGQYREAVEMAERGLDAGAVAESCGISRAEADLIVALHRSRAA